MKKLSSLLFLGACLLPSLGTTFYADCSSNEKEILEDVIKDETTLNEPNVKSKARRPLKRTSKGGVIRPIEKQGESGIQADERVIEESNVRLKPRRQLKRSPKGGVIRPIEKKSESNVENEAEIESRASLAD